ncbi:MAG TPA: CBS domain-containing protein [Anaeromyxobacteraceae bacterium]|jgi:CBS domain-containing protein
MASRRLLQDVPVDELMTAGPATVEPEASLSDAAEALLQGGFRHLPVVSAEGRPLGMISERDVRASLGTDLHGFTRATVEALAEPVSGVMTPEPVAVPLGTRLGEVLDAFASERVGAVLVVDEAERLRGILSYVDVLLWLRDHPQALGAAPLPPGPPARLPPPRPGPARTEKRPARRGGAPRRSGRRSRR